MPVLRRSALVLISTLSATDSFALQDKPKESQAMHGLIGKMKCVPGQREFLAKILIDGVAGMPGCLSYIVANDPTDNDALWITEAWTDQACHKASLSLPSVQAAIVKGGPLIAGFGERHETQPLGGHGLVASANAAHNT